jgi:Ca-activated chloride channel homolog
MEMFRFANPEILYALGIIPVLIFLFIWSRIQRRKAIRTFGNPELIASLMPNVSNFRPGLKFGIAMAALACIIMAMARPQYGSKLQKSNEKELK